MLRTRLESFTTFLGRQSRNFKTLLARDAIVNFANYMVEPYRTLYLRGLGASVTQVGFVNSLSSITNAITSLPAGLLTDRYDLKRLILIGYTLSLFAPILFLLAGSWELAIVATVWGVIVNRISFPALQVTYIDCMADSDRATGMGFFATVRSVVSSIAPIIAAFVVAYFGGISAAGIRPLYAFTLASTVASVIILWRGLTDVGVARAKDRPSRLSFFTDIFKGERAMWQFFLMESARGFTISMANPFFNIYAVEVKDADPFVLGLMTTSRLLITVLLAFPVGRLSDRMGRKKVVYYFRAFRYATDIGLILAPNPQFLVLVGVFRGVRLISQEVSYRAFIYELVPLEKRGRWIALSALVSGVFGAIATPLGGFLYEHVAPELPFVIVTLFDLFVIMPIFSRIPAKRAASAAQ
jgi:MFS family permease